MANRRDLTAVLAVGVLAVIVASVGLFLGFNSDRLGARMPVPAPVPDQGPIVYEMRSVYSEPDRVRFEWRAVEGAAGYTVIVMTAADESLFVSPEIATPYWTIPPDMRYRLQSQTSYHWLLTVRYADREPVRSDPASFATQ